MPSMLLADGKPQSMLERHFQSLALALILAAVTWQAKAWVATGNSVVRMEANIQALQAEVKKLDTYSDSRYTRQEAQSAFDQLNHRMDQFDNRIRHLEEGSHAH